MPRPRRRPYSSNSSLCGRLSSCCNIASSSVRSTNPHTSHRKTSLKYYTLAMSLLGMTHVGSGCLTSDDKRSDVIVALSDAGSVIQAIGAVGSSERPYFVEGLVVYLATCMEGVGC
jgi:hypothetical protein